MNAIDSDDCLRKIDALNSQGQGEAALALAETAVRAGSARMPIYFRLAAACLKAGRYRDALEVTKSAAQLAPGAPGELIELAKRLMYFNQSGLLRDVATRLLAKPVWHAAAEADFAALLSMVGEQALASSLLDRAIAVVGAHSGDHLQPQPDAPVLGTPGRGRSRPQAVPEARARDGEGLLGAEQTAAHDCDGAGAGIDALAGVARRARKPGRSVPALRPVQSSRPGGAIRSGLGGTGAWLPGQASPRQLRP